MRQARIARVVLFLVALLAGVSVVRAADPIRVSASVQNNEVAVGEPFALTIQVDGAQNVPVPTVELDDFRADYLGPSTQVSMVNGHVTQSVGHRYRLIAEREGQFTLGPFGVVYDGKRYESAPITVRVRAAGTRPSAAAVAGDQIKLVVKPATTELYVGQRIPLDVTLYVGNLNVRDLQFPVITADGLTVEKFDQPDQGSEVLDGRRYTAVRLHTTMTMLQPGQTELHGSMQVGVIANRRGGDPFFDQFFGGETKPVQVQSEPVPLTVLALPEAGRPADFTGAVGQFTFDLDAKPTQLDAGDPITLRMTLAGNGNLTALSPPAVPVGDAFRRYDPQPVKGEDSPVRRVYEQVLIPKSPAAREIPAVSFSYFDPAAHAYRSIVRGPIPIEVRASAAAQGQVVDAAPAAAPTPQAPAALGRDIVFIKDTPGDFAPRSSGGHGLGWLLLLWLPPVLGWAGARQFVRRRDRLAADPRLLRFRAAGREARQALAAVSPDDALGLDRISGAMSAYLAAKLGLPPGAIEHARVLTRLEAAGIETELRQRVAQFLELSERARYAPRHDAGERREALALAGAIVDGLERARSLERQLGSVALGLALLALAVLSPARAEAPPPQASFFQGNQAYADGRYADAVQAYEAVRRQGLSSGALEFNLGNAWMKQGDVGRAIAAYTRAARRLPRDPDVGANLAFAREQARIDVPPPPLWLRVAAPFAASFTGGGLAVAATLAWWGLWALLALRLWVGGTGAKLALGRAALALGVVTALLVTSWAARVLELDVREAVVVIAAGDTPARFEPSPNGTEHFAVTAGTPLGVIQGREDWLQVRRADGRRGWIPAAAVEPVD
ncbi:MAG: BatD family protein [Deltaproteobacteria bacterium]|nr:BatD family protein [Deltaproteobacteria bacterium]